MRKLLKDEKEEDRPPNEQSEQAAPNPPVIQPIRSQPNHS
jgi:hypothetical protein